MPAQVGVENLNIALMTIEDTKSSQALYGANQFVSESISINFQPQSSNSVLYADDGAAEADNANGVVNVDVNTKDLPLAIRAAVLGSIYSPSTGGLVHKSTDSPPYLAMSFKSKKANGTYRYIQLYKGKATQPKENYQTKKETTTFNTPTISMQFIRRIFDNVDYAKFDEPIFTDGSTFFDSVYEEPNVATSLTVTTNPADADTGVAVDSDIVWTFNAALNEYTVNEANFIVVDGLGEKVAGTLSVDVTSKIVTFNPTSNLSPLISYIAIVTTNVKNVNGNALSTNSVVNFVTV